MLKYIAFRHEVAGDPAGYWHIFAVSQAQNVLDPRGTVMTLAGPNTEEMKAVVETIANAIDAGAGVAVQQTRWRAFTISAGMPRDGVVADGALPIAGNSPRLATV